jgi:hypothetical protein
MSKMIGTFTTDTLTGAADSCLDLVTLFHRWVSVGIDFSPCSRIEHSVFDNSLKRIVVSLLAHTGIEVTHLDFGLPETSPRDYLSWIELYHIEAVRAELSTEILREPGNSDPATRPKTLSFNQIFMGIISSPRPLHVLKVSRAMARVMDREL